MTATPCDEAPGARALGAVVVLAVLGGAVPAGAAENPAAVPLRLLAVRATAVVRADALRTEVFDEGRLHLHRLQVRRVLRGRLDDTEPGVVDIRGDTKRPPLLGDGEQAIVLLAPAPRLSYLTEHLPEGLAAFAVVGGREGVVPLASDAEREAVEQALADAAAITAPDQPEGIEARRRLAFAEVGGPSPRLVADGVVELRLLPALAPLTDAERDALGRALRSVRNDPATRVALLALVGERGGPGALPVLDGAAADDPAVLDALLEARASLGAPAGRAELQRYLDGDDPAVRAAAVRALARIDDPEALAEVGRYATTDKDKDVRRAAIEGLGASGRPVVLPVLSRTFEDADRDIVQRSGRAMLQIGGPAGDDALVNLALRGRTPDTRAYATLILLVTRGRDNPALRRLEASDPSPEVRAVLEHGLEFRDTHKHD